MLSKGAVTGAASINSYGKKKNGRGGGGGGGAEVRSRHVVSSIFVVRTKVTDGFCKYVVFCFFSGKR